MFNRKLGLFNYYVDNTKAAQDCDRAYKELLLIKTGMSMETPKHKNYLDELK